ncbi:hypothetical protein CRUP_000767 [Coryphaenoides rupestris]|nr:hypothetical protein CRUP_000767 [Coryphaenoides rupestris]
MLGVGYHHAGVDVSDRKMVEEAFTLGDLPVLFTTSTLAMGVNLPAHLVVVKSTTHYVSGSCEEYSEADMLQMIGRAGRPQHLNAEIVLLTISDVSMALDWIRSTFLYIRALRNPQHYDLLMLGVGYHHAGVDMSDRKMVEEAFTLGDLPVLFTTSTLAMGVNLPAHLVVVKSTTHYVSGSCEEYSEADMLQMIGRAGRPQEDVTTSTLAMGVNLPAHLVVVKSTTHYVSGSCEEYSEADMLQMIGRAGRPQFDTSATAVIMTKTQTKDKYMQLMNGMEIIESSLHGHLVEHLNAEIVLLTISDVSMALDWIRSTFLYIRALRNPQHYGFSADLDRCGIEAKLQELCLKNLNSLSSIGLISMDEDVNIKPTEAGRLMARYCVAFDTMKQFNSVEGHETLADLLRVSEKRTLNILNKDKNRVTIRFPMDGKIRTNDMKVNCLIQAQLGSISIQEFGLTQDTAKIFRNGIRISKCLSEFLIQRSKTGLSAQLNSLLLAKCFRAKLWEDSPYVSKQLEKIGLTLSTAMVNAGLTTFSRIEETNPRELELIVNRHPPFGNQIKESVVNLPKYEVSLEQLPRYSCATAEMVVTVRLKNMEQLLSRRPATVPHPPHHVTLVMGDSDDRVVFLQKLTDVVLLKSGSWSKKMEVVHASKGEEKFSVFYSGARRYEADSVSHDAHRAEWKMQKMPFNPGGKKSRPPAVKAQSTAQHNAACNTEKGKENQ